MHHVTKYCNVIGVHCTVRRDKLVYAVHQTLPFLAQVGLACETRPGPGIETLQLVAFTSISHLIYTWG